MIDQTKDEQITKKATKNSVAVTPSNTPTLSASPRSSFPTPSTSKIASSSTPTTISLLPGPHSLAKKAAKKQTTSQIPQKTSGTIKSIENHEASSMARFSLPSEAGVKSLFANRKRAVCFDDSDNENPEEGNLLSPTY